MLRSTSALQAFQKAASSSRAMVRKSLLTLFRSRRLDQTLLASPADAIQAAASIAVHPDLFLSSDQAIRLGSEDRLGFGETLVPKLIRVALDWPSERGIVVGLYGPWGAGKTSLLNMFTEKLVVSPVDRPRARSAIVVRFTPAFYDDYAALVRTFFSTIARELGRGGAKTEQIARHMRVIGGFLAAAKGGVQAFVPGVAPIVEGMSTAFTKTGEASVLLDDGERTLHEAREEAERGLRQMAADGQRVVVLLDDLERLHRPELLNLLRLVRFIADLPNITVVLSMDDVRVRSLLNEGKESGGDYGRNT